MFSNSIAEDQFIRKDFDNNRYLATASPRIIQHSTKIEKYFKADSKDCLSLASVIVSFDVASRNVRVLEMDVKVPLDVPRRAREDYIKNYLEITKNSGRLMLFAGDQKVEHLNDDFYGPGIAEDDADPEHLFRIASRGRIGVFATQLGLIARYGMDYPEVPYLIKLNSKTNLIETSQADPVSRQWIDLSQVLEFKKESGLKILGVGYTVYPGSEHESLMLREAAQLVYDAHKNGLVVVLWIYPRGKAVKDERDPHLIAGACGLAASWAATSSR